ncbi:MAG: alpha/beta hydrolase [Gammaproteobacteria bacterium]|nr:alpha/beta hydrolase [Gammaproteobacteria bacterium]
MHSSTQTSFIQGPAGKLELIFEQAQGDTTHSICFIMCHPHPLQEGTMHNKVVTTTCKAFQQMGCHTLRFNFRGVGLSEGSYGEGLGEIEDCLSVITWVKQQFPEHSIWLGGFSFGGAVAYSAANRASVAQLLTITPGITRFPALQKIEPLMPWLIIQGEADEVIEPEAVYTWLSEHKASYELVKWPDVGHFFHGRLIELKQKLIEIYQPRLTA